MHPLKDRRAIIAVDLGAQSCRVSLLRWCASGPRIEQVHRIPNAPISRNGSLYWDWTALCHAADEGIRRAAAIAEEGVAAIGVTGWAVDYLRLQAETANAGVPFVEGDERDGARLHPISNPFCYRDARTTAALAAVHERISPARLYALTGIHALPLNTLYQLYADGTAGISQRLPWLNLPEAMLYRWGARPVAEYTNATHTGLVELATGNWSPEIFSAAGLDLSAAPEIVPPGSVVGRLEGPLGRLPALRDALLIAPACHDTASAIAGIPAHGEAWAYISSGTWSLVGTLLDAPCVGKEAAGLNFTNEGGVGGKVCFLRNVNGLWLWSQCMERWRAAGSACTEEDLIDEASRLPEPEFLLDVDDADLLAPGDMPRRILAQLQRRFGAASAPELSPAAMTRLLFSSLAARYASAIEQAAALTGKRFQRLYIVGGGNRNALLNRLTQQATGIEVIRGAAESSTVGNFSVQLAALEKIERGGAAANRPGVEHDAVTVWASRLANAFRPTAHGSPAPVVGKA